LHRFCLYGLVKSSKLSVASLLVFHTSPLGLSCVDRTGPDSHSALSTVLQSCRAAASTGVKSSDRLNPQKPNPKWQKKRSISACALQLHPFKYRVHAKRGRRLSREACVRLRDHVGARETERGELALAACAGRVRPGRAASRDPRPRESRTFASRLSPLGSRSAKESRPHSHTRWTGNVEGGGVYSI
jgi:hypothetical protein